MLLNLEDFFVLRSRRSVYVFKQRVELKHSCTLAHGSVLRLCLSRKRSRTVVLNDFYWLSSFMSTTCSLPSFYLLTDSAKWIWLREKLLQTNCFISKAHLGERVFLLHINNNFPQISPLSTHAGQIHRDCEFCYISYPLQLITWLRSVTGWGSDSLQPENKPWNTTFQETIRKI